MKRKFVLYTIFSQAHENLFSNVNFISLLKVKAVKKQQNIPVVGFIDQDTASNQLVI